MTGISLPDDATKANMDASTDDPKLARAELADLVDKFNSLLDEVGSDRLQWNIELPGVAYASSTSFTTTDTSACHNGRWVQIVGSSTGTVYGRITDVSGSTITVSGVTLSNETLTAWLGVAALKNTSIPFPRITPQMLGDVGTADDTTVFQAFAAMPGAKHIPDGTYVLSEQVTFDADTDLTFGNVTLDFSAAATAGDFPDNACVFLDGGDLTALPALSGDVSEGANTLTFASAPSLSEGDVIMIYNSTDSSFSGHRTSYRAGEFCRVLSVSDTTVTIYGGLYAGYTAANVDLYKLSGIKMHLGGTKLHIVAPSGLNDVRCLEAKRLVDSRIDDVSGSGSGNAAVMFAQCYNMEADGLAPRQNENGGSTTDYGLVIANCQKVRAQGDFYGRRHAVTLGGEDEIGVVPNRDIRCKGTFTNDADSGVSIAAANAHGNSEHYHFEGVFNGGINPSGDHGTFKGTVFVPSSKEGIAVYFGELLGWSFDLSGLKIIAHGDPDAVSSRGTIDLGGGSNEATASTIRGGILNLSNIKASAPGSNRAVKIRNRGSAPTDPIIVDLSGTEFYSLASGIVTGLQIDAVSGDNFDRLILTDFFMDGDPAYSFNDVDAVKGWRVSGTVTFTPDTAANFDDVAVVFPRTAPKVPHVTISYADNFISGVFPVVAAVSPSTTGFTARLATPDASNFASATNRTAYYVATLDEG